MTLKEMLADIGYWKAVIAGYDSELAGGLSVYAVQDALFRRSVAAYVLASLEQDYNDAENTALESLVCEQG